MAQLVRIVSVVVVALVASLVFAIAMVSTVVLAITIVVLRRLVRD